LLKTPLVIRSCNLSNNAVTSAADSVTGLAAWGCAGLAMDEAIAEAIRMAVEGDIILLAGKGHETGQIIGDKVLPFDDALVARECAA